MNVHSRRMSKDIVYENLKQKIIFNELSPNEDVKEDQLSTLLDVSRTPLRESIQRLEMENFLVRQPNGRLKVAQINLNEVEEIFEIRSLLEGQIAKHATRNAMKEDILNLSKLLERLDHFFKIDDKQNFVTIGNEFHDYLAKISGLNTTIRLLNIVRDHAERYSRFVSVYGKWNEQAVEEHYDILKCIVEKDELGAENAMKIHLMSSLRVVLERVKELHLSKGGI
ncbi:GntR family transcriptional regulator [Metabacillus sp. FJAT-53654]|uniref:GntR family transcriptional regulator n=1 Tax=Metabacillus rhizosphaerae TaxID=3117747 RepID=A0ABZ2N1X5_9BACI